jgi:hypothetical protein
MMNDFSESDDQSLAGRKLSLTNKLIISECPQTFEERPQIVEMGIEML